jgi:hypothetical protein
VILLADAWTAVGSVAAVVAAGAALVTVLYARSTVSEARAGRRESHQAHEEEVAEQRAAAAEAAHREEMRHRERALETELTLQRTLAAERVAGILLDLIRQGNHEANQPPEFIAGTGVRVTLIPAMLTRLGVAIETLEALRGPTLNVARQVARDSSGGSDPQRVASGAVGALTEVYQLVQNAGEFQA